MKNQGNLEQILEKNIIVFGTGEYCQENLKYIQALVHIVCFADNDVDKRQAFDCSDIPCVSPEEILNFHADAVIIAVENEKAIWEISKQLEKIQIECIALKEILPECIRKWDEREIARYMAMPFEKDWKDGKIVRYVECYMLRQACNLRCSYCFVPQARDMEDRVIPFLHSPEFMAKALSKKRLGGTSLISICCDGEPLMSEDMVIFIRLLLEEGHYVYLISNGTVTKRMEQLCSFPKMLLNHLFIRFSFHYFELKRLNLMDIFFQNIKNFHAKGGSFTLFLVGSEAYLEYIEDIKRLSIQNLGALPHVDYERDEHNNDGGTLTVQTSTDFSSYKEIWEEFDSRFLQFREQVDGKITGDCYAGKWVLHLDLMTGEASRCPAGSYVGNVYQDICGSIPFDEEPHPCPLDFCVCAPVFFAFGMRPDYRNVPTFYELWNRVDRQGKSWIQDSAREFFSERLDINHGL